MQQKIQKPANWESFTFDDLFQIEAGRAYVAKQLGGDVDPIKTFQSDRSGAYTCRYDLFDDGSLWFHNNAQDQVWADAVDFVRELWFGGLYWEETPEKNDFILIDRMDRDLLVYLWGEEDAHEFFEQAGGLVPEVDVQQ